MKEVEYELLNDALVLRLQSGAITMADDLFLITECASAKNITILKAAGGDKIGYVLWGMVGKHCALNIINHGVMPRYFYEFSEGKICVILGVFSAPGRAQEFARQLKGFIKKHRVLLYMKKHKAIFLKRKSNSFFNRTKKQFDSPAFSGAV